MNVYDSNPVRHYDLSNVGHGYRNACWIPPSNFGGKTGVGKIKLFGYDKEGNEAEFVFPFYPSVKYEVKQHTSEKDLYGKNIATKWFDDTQARRAWCEAMEGKAKIISCYPPEQEFLLGLFRKYVFDDTFNHQKIRTHYIDIEVAIENEFPEPEVAKYPINLITVCDSRDRKFYSWALGDVKNTITDFEVELRAFDSESELLTDYLKWHTENYPSIFAGWNTKFFDITYIVKRMENVLGKENSRRFSPIGKYSMREDKKQYGKKFISVKGISNLDMLFLYRDKFNIKASLDGGYNLDNVANEEIDDAKIHYDGSMLDFYKQDFQRFWEYNVQDVNLVVKLDEKLKLTSIARKITSFGCSQLESIYTTISYIIASLDIYSRNNRNKVFLSYASSDSRGKDVEQYEGAFVFPTYAGLYTQGVMCADVNSLYPNTARSLNLSPETMLGTVEKVVHVSEGTNDEYYTYAINFVNGQFKELSQEEFDNLLATTCILSRNNVLFVKHEIKRGIFSDWCGNFFAMRKGYKKRKAEAEEKLDKLKRENCQDAELIRKLEMEVELNETTQYALKIMINSAYGTLGTTFSPIYDTRLAEAITLGGQFCNRSTSMFLNKYFHEHYGTDEKFNITISGDTDSVTEDMELQLRVSDDIV